jgi:hypothetical protein
VLLPPGGQASVEGDVEGVEGGFPAVGPALLYLAGGVQAHDREVDAFSAAASVGKWPRALTARRIRALIDSMVICPAWASVIPVRMRSARAGFSQTISSRSGCTPPV